MAAASIDLWLSNEPFPTVLDVLELFCTFQGGGHWELLKSYFTLKIKTCKFQRVKKNSLRKMSWLLSKFVTLFIDPESHQWLVFWYQSLGLDQEIVFLQVKFQKN